MNHLEERIHDVLVRYGSGGNLAVGANASPDDSATRYGTTAFLPPEPLQGRGSGRLEQALHRASEQLDRDQFIRLVMTLGDAFKQHGELSKAEAMYTLALVKGEFAREDSAIGEALISRGDVYSYLGRWKQSTADVRLGRKIYRTLNKKLGVGRAETILGINYAVGGDVKRAKVYLKRALDSFERYDDKLLSGIAQMNLGTISRILGDVDGAMQQFQRARSCFEEVGDLARLAELHYKTGVVLLARKEENSGIVEFEKCGALAARLGNRRYRGLAFYGKASVYFASGDLRTALTLSDQALDQFSIYDDRAHVADVYKLKGAIHREMKKYEFAHWYLYTSLRMHLELDNFFSAAESYYELGMLHTQRHRVREAKRALAKSVECYRKAGALQEVKRVSSALQGLRGKPQRELRRSRKTKI